MDKMFLWIQLHRRFSDLLENGGVEETHLKNIASNRASDNLSEEEEVEPKGLCNKNGEPWNKKIDLSFGDLNILKIY